MIIYELIYFTSSKEHGGVVTNSIITLDKNQVDKYISEYANKAQKLNLGNPIAESNSDECYSITYELDPDNFMQLIVKKHNI